MKLIEKETIKIISERDEVQSNINMEIEANQNLTKDIGLNSLELAKLIAKLEIILDVGFFVQPLEISDDPL